MNSVRISDMTMKQSSKGSLSLSFKEKLELSKLLDRLGVSVIELEEIRQPKIDCLLIKSIASAVKDSVLAVPVGMDAESIRMTWNALQTAVKPRLQICAPVSTVQMEYLFHKKPEAMLSAIRESIQLCCTLCRDVEFIADDATRSDDGFLYQALEAAIEAGASTVTVCDTAGAMLPDEFSAFISGLSEHVTGLDKVSLGVSCSNSLSMADACAIAAVKQGARELKAAAYPIHTASLPNLAGVLAVKGSALGLSCPIRTTEINRITEQVAKLCQTGLSKSATFGLGVQENSENVYLTAHDEPSAVAQAVTRLGYDLSEEDSAHVYKAFLRIAAKKEKVSIRELDAIVAAAAMQVPPTYLLESYLITAGNSIAATAHMKLLRQDQMLEGVSLGDGPIDAAFHALEQITGHHYELDDFQIQAVTEGREAMGQTVVKLRSGGKVYSGKGISTDIVGASIHAYLNALNKIVYEEAAL